MKTPRPPKTTVTFSAVPLAELAELQTKGFKLVFEGEYTIAANKADTVALLDSLGVSHDRYLAKENQ